MIIQIYISHKNLFSLKYKTLIKTSFYIFTYIMIHFNSNPKKYLESVLKMRGRKVSRDTNIFKEWNEEETTKEEQENSIQVLNTLNLYTFGSWSVTSTEGTFSDDVTFVLWFGSWNFTPALCLFIVSVNKLHISI